MAPQKNVELIGRSSERHTNNSDFIRPFDYVDHIQRNLDHISSTGYIANHFEVLWAFSALLDQSQQICYSYNSVVRYCTFTNHAIWLVESILCDNSTTGAFPDIWYGKSTITIIILSDYYQGNQVTKLKGKYKMSYFGAFFVQIWKKTIFQQNLDFFGS